MSELPAYKGQNLPFITELPVNRIKPSPFGIRCSRTGILELSIKDQGILEPIMVREKKNGAYTHEVIFGDGRLEWAKKLKDKTIPVVIKNCDDNTALLRHIDENSARDNFTFPEKAKAYFLLKTQRHMIAEDIAQRYNESKATVLDAISYWESTENAPEVRKAVENDKVPTGYLGRVIDITKAKPGFSNEVILAAAKGKLDFKDVVEVAALTPKADMIRLLEKAVKEETNLKDIRESATRNAMAKTAHVLVQQDKKDKKKERKEKSQSEILLSSNSSLIGVSELTPEEITEIVSDPVTENLKSGSRKIGGIEWICINHIIRPILKMTQANLKETAEVVLEQECSKCKKKLRFRVNLDHEGIHLDLGKADFVIAKDSLEEFNATLRKLADAKTKDLAPFAEVP